MEQASAFAEVSLVLERLEAQRDVFVCGPLSADAEGALISRLTGIGAGVVVSASRQRLEAVGQRLAGRRLRVVRRLRGKAGSMLPKADVELVALQQLATTSGERAWALLLSDVLPIAMDSTSQRHALRELLARVDAACVLVDLNVLCRRYASLLCLEPDSPATLLGGGLRAEDAERVVATVSDATTRHDTTVHAVEKNGAATKAKQATLPPDDVVFEGMRVWRREQAKARGVPAYRVMSDRVLRDVINEAPKDLASLRLIPGIGDKTVETLGRDMLTALAHVRATR